MSTILKALKRLDEERRAETSPRTLEEEVLTSGAGRSRAGGERQKLMFAAVGALAALAIVGGSWLAIRERPEPGAASPRPGSGTELSLAEPRPALPARAPDDAYPAASPALDAGQGVERALRGQGAASVAPPISTAPSEVAAAPEPSAAPVEDAAQAARAERAAAELARAQSAGRTALAEPAAAPVEPASSVQPAEPPPRTARQLAPPARETQPERAPEVAASAAEPMRAAERPAVWVDRTQWHPSPDKRRASVRIGNDGEVRELREGDASDGIVVKEIRPSSVTFVRDGEEFERGVGGG